MKVEYNAVLKKTIDTTIDKNPANPFYILKSFDALTKPLNPKKSAIEIIISITMAMGCRMM
jgi:hypothetical protein